MLEQLLRYINRWYLMPNGVHMLLEAVYAPPVVEQVVENVEPITNTENAENTENTETAENPENVETDTAETETPELNEVIPNE